MKKGLFLALCAALLGTAAMAAGGADTTRRTITGGVIHSIDASSGFAVTITWAEKAHAVVSIDKRLEPYLVCRVEEGELKLGFRDLPRELQSRNKWNQQPRAQVTVTGLREIDLSSGASVRGTLQVIPASEVEIDASSGASVKDLILKADRVSVDVSSGASVALEGEAGVLDADCSSGASASLSKLRAKQVEAEVSSGASVRCFATELIRAKASSGGSVGYKKIESTQVYVQTSSGGSIKELK